MATEATVLPSFPLPPPFFKLYAEDDSGTSPLPPDPPSMPEGASFVVFGQAFDPEEPQVPALQGRRLYDQAPDGTVDIKGELSRLNTELIFVYSELLRVLVQNPANYTSPLNTMNQILANMQHLINMLRPVQARASLEYSLKLQIQDKVDILSSLRSQMEAIDKTVASAVTDLQQQCGADSADDMAE